MGLFVGAFVKALALPVDWELVRQNAEGGAMASSINGRAISPDNWVGWIPAAGESPLSPLWMGIKFYVHDSERGALADVMRAGVVGAYAQSAGLLGVSGEVYDAMTGDERMYEAIKLEAQRLLELNFDKVVLAVYAEGGSAVRDGRAALEAWLNERMTVWRDTSS